MKTLASFMIASLVSLAAPAANAEPGSTRVLAIVAPVEKQTVLANDGSLVISFAANPPLAEGERIVVRIDDQVVVLASGITGFAMTDVPIGAHVVDAIVVDDDANPVALAKPVSFYVHFGLRI